VAGYEAERVLQDQQPHLGQLDSWRAWQAWRDALDTALLFLRDGES
jgi:hypothetical protein